MFDQVRPRIRTDADLITCAAHGCGTRFYNVPERGWRAPFCLDHADLFFGESGRDPKGGAS